MNKKISEVELKADVLVVGAGAGGMMAAIGAADLGSDVILCEIGNARRSGGIMAGNDHFWCYLPEIHSPATKEKMIKDQMSIFGGQEEQVRRQVELTSEVLKMWEAWGVNMKTDGHYEFTGHGWPGSTGKYGEPGNTNREWLHFSDNNMCPKIEKQVRKRNVRIMNRVMVTELIQDTSGRVEGAVGISTREPTLYIINVRSVIINKGGVSANRLYPPPYLFGYSMAQPGTGNGALMALRAGAELQDAEKCIRQVSLRFGPFAGKGTWIGILVDNEGKPIAPPYLSKPDPEIGDPAVENADALDHVWATGKGPVWMNPEGITVEDERYMRWGFESEGMLPFLEWLDQEKIDIRRTRFEFTSMQPVCLLHIRVDENMRTKVEGLYGIPFGFLSLSAVGGLMAGRSAAGDCDATTPLKTERRGTDISKLKNTYEAILNREGGRYANWREAQKAVFQLMHCYALPPLRTGGTLAAGYHQLTRLRNRTRESLKAGNWHDLYHCIEVLNLMDVAELVLLAVKERKESRGQARRMDYPFINPMLNQPLVISQKDGRPVFTWQ